jgi:glycosyltransferase involved in cell wall biosynthesis
VRVLLITNMYPSLDNPAYGSFVARQQGRLTSEHGVSFKVVASQETGGGGASLGKYLSLARRVLGASVLGGYDVVHAHYLLPTAALALLPSWLRRKPLVITAHGTDIYTGRRRFWRGLIRRAVARACRVIVVSEFLGRELEEGFGTRHGGLVVCNMGVDTERFKTSDREEAKRTFGVDDPPVPHLVFVGNFVEQKGVEDLGEALNELAEMGIAFRATLVGEGPLQAEVEEQVHELGDRVRFYGFVPHPQLPAVLGAADLFMMPSRREGVGLLVCLEALSSGVPVLATDAGGLPEIVRDGVNGATVPAGDPHAFAAALARLCSDPAELERLALAARDSALPFDERRQAAVVAGVYEDCSK